MKLKVWTAFFSFTSFSYLPEPKRFTLWLKLQGSERQLQVPLTREEVRTLRNQMNAILEIWDKRNEDVK